MPATSVALSASANSDSAEASHPKPFAKTVKTKSEIEELVMQEARKFSECATCTGAVIAPVDWPSATWDLAELVNGTRSAYVAIAPMIAALQSRFDLKR